MNVKRKPKKVVLKKDIQDSIIPEHTKQIATKFFNDLNLQNISAARQRKLFQQMCNCYKLELIDKETPLTQWTEMDLQNTIANINAMGEYSRTYGVRVAKTYVHKYSDNTKADYRRFIRQFLNFMEQYDERLDSDDTSQRGAARRLYSAKKKIDIKQSRKKVNPNTLIKLEDLRLILKVTDSLHNRALLTTLYFTGLRIGGLMDLKIKDVVRSDKLWQLHVTDKTGTDTIPVHYCVPFLSAWLDKMHPDPNNPEAYLFCKRNGGQLTYHYVESVARRTRAQIKAYTNNKWDKPLNAHHLRHSRATRDCTKYNPETFKRIMKWSPNSRAMQNYLHFNTEDIAKQYASANGIEGFGEVHDNDWICVTCTTLNEVHSEYCMKCNRPKQLTLKEEEEIEKQQQLTLRSQFMAELMLNPKLNAIYQQWVNAQTGNQNGKTQKI